jgi:lysophospholipase L1-like esterase
MRLRTAVAIGDSISLGVGDDGRGATGDRGWAAHVAAALGAEAFVNLARNGTRARDLADDQVPQALALRPDLVLLTIGGNDVLRGDFAPREVEHATAHAILAFRADGAEVVLVTLAPIRLLRHFPSPVTNVMAARIAEANAALEAAGVAGGALLVDGSAVMRLQGDSAWHVDRIHPSQVGHRALAERAVGLLPQFGPAEEITPPDPPPGYAATAWWTLRNGLPWVAKRSRDLIPQIAIVVARDIRRARIAEAREARALLDERGTLRSAAIRSAATRSIAR